MASVQKVDMRPRGIEPEAYFSALHFNPGTGIFLNFWGGTFNLFGIEIIFQGINRTKWNTASLST